MSVQDKKAMESGSTEPAPTVTTEASQRSRVEPVRGKPVSGRTWKAPKEKFSKMITTPKLRQSWDKKQEQRARLKAIKEREKETLAVRETERQAQIDRIKQNRERREANALKSASYQVVSNTSKLKKLSKKEFRSYRKLADVNK